MKNKIIITSLLGFTTFAAMPVSATEQIAYMLFGDPAYQTKCNVCHVNGTMYSADKGNLMSAAKSAYNQDKWGLSGLKTFVAAAVPAVPAPKTCTSPQILDTATNACFTPVPVCTGGTVLNTAKDGCITPPPVVPVCKTTEVLTNNVCVAIPVVTPPTPTVPVCADTQVLNATKTACIAKPTTPVLPPVATKNTKPVLNAVAQQWDAKVGELITIPLSVKDAEGDEFIIVGSKLVGSKFSSVHPDAAGLPSIDFEWTPTLSQVNKIQSMTFYAKETKTKEKYASNSVKVKVRVWAAGNRDVASITKLNVMTSVWNAGKLSLAGNVVFNNLLTATEQKTFIAQKFDLTVTNGKSATGGALLGAAPLTLDAKGNWSIVLPVAQSPCDVTLQFDGQNASRTVNGAPATCLKVASSTSNTTPLQFAENENEGNERENGHGKHDD